MMLSFDLSPELPFSKDKFDDVQAVLKESLLWLWLAKDCR